MAQEQSALQCAVVMLQSGPMRMFGEGRMGSLLAFVCCSVDLQLGLMAVGL